MKKVKIIQKIKNKLLSKKPQAKGFSLIELMLSIGILAIFLPALFLGFSASRNGRPQMEQRQAAIQLVREAQEAVRVVRERDWKDIAQDGTYHPVITSSTWVLQPSSETIEGTYQRSVTISDVYRDGSGNISSSGTLDTSTKKITTTVHWNTPFATDVSSVMYLTRNDNKVYTETSEGQFKAVTYPASISVTNNSGGELTLGPGVGGGDWCKPGQNTIGSYDLTHNGVPIAITAAAYATQDIAFATTGNNASGYTLDKISISHAKPPAVSDPNAITGPKGYGIFTDGTYIYANENNPPNHTVLIANTSDLSQIGYFDVKNGTGTSVYVSGNTGYTTVGSSLYAFDVTQKTGSRPQKGATVSLAGIGNKVVVFGANAYVVTANTTKQLQIIDSTTMTITKTINLGNNLPGVDVALSENGKYAYVVTSYSAGKNDFFIIDLTNTNNIWGYTTSGMNPKGIIVPVSNRAVLVGQSGELYQVFDITTPSNASHCGGMSPAGVSSINAVAGVTRPDGTVYSYIMTDNATAEFQIIQGGPGGTSGTYTTNGTYESATFDALHDVAFNYFFSTVSIPASTSLTYKLAIKHGITSGGSTTCSGVPFTESDFIPFTPGQIPLSTSDYMNPGQCLRYRVTLTTTDTSVTPVLYDISFNYSL